MSSSSNTAPTATKLSDRYSSWKYLRPFIFGGIAGCGATTIIQPIDMVKVRCVAC